MRIRSVKPEFFKHDVLGSLSPIARLLFIGMWCMADCAGRLEDRPKRIKVEVLPYDDADVEQLLSELCEHGFILRYSVEDQPLIEIPSFARHQRITGKESEQESRFPSYQKKKVVKQRGNNGETPEKHPESLETEGKGDVCTFDEFWCRYPKKKAKDQAVKAFAKVRISREILFAALDKQKADPDWLKDNGKYIPYPATWLNGKRWEDSLEPVVLELPVQQVEWTPEAFKTPAEMLAERKAKEEAANGTHG